MNQKLVESLAQIILSLSDEERQALERSIQRSSALTQIKGIEDQLKNFEEKYQMSSEHFHRRFQAGELGDGIDFFEWNTYYEMLTATKSEAA